MRDSVSQVGLILQRISIALTVMNEHIWGLVCFPRNYRQEIIALDLFIFRPFGSAIKGWLGRKRTTEIQQHLVQSLGPLQDLSVYEFATVEFTYISTELPK